MENNRFSQSKLRKKRLREQKNINKKARRFEKVFGLSFREQIAKMVKRSCENNISVYEAVLKGTIKYFENKYKDEEVDAAELEKEMQDFILKARIIYTGAVFKEMYKNVSDFSSISQDLFHSAVRTPSITGLPEEVTSEYLKKEGISASVVFAFTYYAYTKEKIETASLIRTASKLAHYQTYLMNRAASDIFSNA